MKVMLFLLFIQTFFMQIALGQNLEEFLYLDRFHYYCHELSSNLNKKGNNELAKKINSLTPEILWSEIKQTSTDLEALKDTHLYDNLIQKILLKKYPNISKDIASVSSNYNFFKNKLNESFVVKKINADEMTPAFKNTTLPKNNYEIPRVDGSKMTLNADHYISNRQTRAIFWDAIKNNRDIEFYLESFQESLAMIQSKGGVLQSEIITLASNYNKIYLIHYPETGKYSYVITDISGTDRLHHLTKQMDYVSWNSTLASAKFNNQVSVYGHIKDLTEIETRKMTNLLELLPKADHVIIGQKAALEKNLRLYSKVQKLLKLFEDKPELLDKLSEADLRLINQIKESNDITEAFYQNSKWENIFQTFKDKIPDEEIIHFNIESNSHALSDIEIKTQDGKIKRFRFISNVWGNEVTPVAQALANTGHTNITYIGTAGGIKDESLKVGDLISPINVELQSGKTIDLPPPTFSPRGLKRQGELTQVASLLDESESWLEQQIKNSKTLVEMEVGYVAEVVDKNPKMKLNVFLLVSDLVGEEGETLDQANSSLRKKSQLNVISDLLKSEGISSVESLKEPQLIFTKNLPSTVTKRNELALFQLSQAAKKKYGNVALDASKLAIIEAENPSFTASALQKRLSYAQSFLDNLEKSVPSVEIAIDEDLMDGSYNPKKKLKIYVKDASQINELQEIIAGDKDLKNAIDLLPATNGNIFLTTQELKKNNLLKIYNHVALNQGGLLGKVSQKGNLSFLPIPTIKKCDINFKDLTGATP